MGRCSKGVRLPRAGGRMIGLGQKRKRPFWGDFAPKVRLLATMCSKVRLEAGFGLPSSSCFNLRRSQVLKMKLVLLKQSPKGGCMIIFPPGWPQRQQNGHFTYTNFNIIGQIPLDLGVEVRLLRKSVQGHCQKKNPPCGELIGPKKNPALTRASPDFDPRLTRSSCRPP